MNIIATMRELICRRQEHNIDAITGVCRLCRQPILPPISTPESAGAHQHAAAQTTYAVAPGEYLIEYADTHDLDEQGLADHLKFSRTLTRELLDGSRHLTESIAFDLQSATGIPMNHWLAIDDLYERDLARLGRRRAAHPISHRLIRESNGKNRPAEEHPIGKGPSRPGR